MKAWIVRCDDDWIALWHADTAGQAKAAVREEYNTDEDYIMFSAKRFKEMDDKKFTHQACKDAGFQFFDDDYGMPINADDFHNDCRCEICKHEQA